MTLDELIELHETRYLRLYKNPSNTDELEMCEQTLSCLRELKQTMGNFSGRQMLNAALAIQMIADLKGSRIDDKHIVLDSICGDSYYWDAIIDWAVRVMTTNKYITPSMETNFMKRMYEQEEEARMTLENLIAWHESKARKCAEDDFVAEEKIEAYSTTAQYLREYARAVKRINFLEERIAKYHRELLEKEMEAIE